MKIFYFASIGLVAVALISFAVYISRVENVTVDKMVGVSTILTGLASIIVGIISVYVMLSQASVQETLMQFQKAEHQPTFVVKYNLGKSEGSEVYDYEEYEITNIGERVKSLVGIDLKTFVKITYNNWDNKTSVQTYIPITYFYNASSRTGDMQGVVSYSIGSQHLHNHGRFSDLYMEALKYCDSHKSVYLEVNRIQLFKINYTDIYNEAQTQYICNKNVSDSEFYNSVISQSEKDFPNQYYNLKDLNLDILWRDCLPLKAVH